MPKKRVKVQIQLRLKVNEIPRSLLPTSLRHQAFSIYPHSDKDDSDYLLSKDPQTFGTLPSSPRHTFSLSRKVNPLSGKQALLLEINSTEWGT